MSAYQNMLLNDRSKWLLIIFSMYCRPTVYLLQKLQCHLSHRPNITQHSGCYRRKRSVSVRSGWDIYRSVHELLIKYYRVVCFVMLRRFQLPIYRHGPGLGPTALFWAINHEKLKIHPQVEKKRKIYQNVISRVEIEKLPVDIAIEFHVVKVIRSGF